MSATARTFVDGLTADDIKVVRICPDTPRESVWVKVAPTSSIYADGATVDEQLAEMICIGHRIASQARKIRRSRDLAAAKAAADTPRLDIA